MLAVHSCAMCAEPEEPYYFRVTLRYIQLRDLILFSPLILFSHLILLKDFLTFHINIYCEITTKLPVLLRIPWPCSVCWSLILDLAPVWSDQKSLLGRVTAHKNYFSMNHNIKAIAQSAKSSGHAFLLWRWSKYLPKDNNEEFCCLLCQRRWKIL